MQASFNHVGVVGKRKFLCGWVLQASLNHVGVIG